MSNNIYISIISHNQENLIIENFINFPKKLSDFTIKLSILDNTGSKELEKFCLENEIFYYHDSIRRGFGKNHNKMFKLLEPKDDDIFIVCNPDITILDNQLQGLIENFKSSNTDIGAPRSYLNKDANFLDYPDRYFPYLANFIISIALGKRLHYGKNEDQEYPQWISGSFILFKPSVFRELNGFDESYHMYCEDIDICFRAKQKNYKIKLDTQYYIEHHSQMASRELISKSILWHMKSALKFSIKSKRVFGLMIAKS